MRATISVPATSANLGPGYDVFGLALGLTNELTIDTDRGSGIRWDGEGASDLAVDGSDLITATIRRIASGMGLDAPSAGLDARNRIPLARGLGSSSAAVVAGVVAASLLLDLGWEHDPWSVFAAAAEIEGHPDNAAPAVFGGFTIAMPDGYVRRHDPHPDLRPAVIVPPYPVATGDARAVLPPAVDLADAVHNIAHAALAVEAFTTDPGLLPRALGDRLHQEVRIALGGLEGVTAALRAARVPFCVSGSGPSLLAFETGAGVDLDQLGVGSDWTILRPGLRLEGFTVSRDGS
jgi:homoserine kinase